MLCVAPPALQVRVQEYNQVKGQLGQMSRKATGSLAVRDLSGIVKEHDIVNTENLVTLFVVVSKHTKNDWLANYEKLCEFIVSASAPCLLRGSSHALQRQAEPECQAAPRQQIHCWAARCLDWHGDAGQPWAASAVAWQDRTVSSQER